MADFEVKDVIGRGHFGEVQVVIDKVTSTVYAMKILHKHETLAQQEVSLLIRHGIESMKHIAQQEVSLLIRHGIESMKHID